MTIDRREFLKRAGGGVGLLAGGGAAGLLTGCASTATPADPAATPARTGAAVASRPTSRSPDVVVVGAGAFGGWTALNLVEMGARVTLVDSWGPGNSRSTSGDETRGIRTGYADKVHWSRWANEAIGRWKRFDEEWGAAMRYQLFFHTGDLILREDWEPFTEQTRATWELLGIEHEVLTAQEVAYRWPQIDVSGMSIALHETNAGVARARRACEVVAAVFRHRGGELRIAHAALGRRDGDRLADVVLTPGQPLRADTFVFACGPWLPKVVPEAMANKLRTPLGHVFYYGTPPGDTRFTYPNLPSYNFPGVTGWPALPPDNRGFRVRTGGREPQDPDLSVRWFDETTHERPRQVLRDRFPALADAPLLETRSCHYELSVNRDFVVDLHPGLENVWIVGAGNAEGFKMGPVMGEYAARRILGQPTDPELTEKFRLPTETLEAAPVG